MFVWSVCGMCGEGGVGGLFVWSVCGMCGEAGVRGVLSGVCVGCVERGE